MSESGQPIEFDENPPVPIEDYERTIEIASPGYSAMHTMLSACLKSRLMAKTDVNLLVVGAGGGAEIINFCRHNPLWKMVGVDPSKKMLDLAQRKVKDFGFSNQVSWVNGYVSDLPISPEYDAATSILVMQFLPNDGKKSNFLKEIFRRIRPLGSFVLVDVIRDREDVKFEEMIQFVRSYRDIMGVPENVHIKAMEAFSKGVYPLSEEGELELLRNTGFVNIIRFYTGMWINGWIATVPEK